MDVETKNLFLIRKRFPVAWQRLQECPISTCICENNILRSNEGNKTLFPYGQKNPTALLKRWADSLSISPNSCNATTGFGDHVTALLQKLPQDSYLFVVERSPAFMRGLLRLKDFSEVLNHPRVFLVVGKPDDTAFDVFNDCNVAYTEKGGVFLYSPLHAIDEAYYDEALSEFLRNVRRFQQLQRTNIEDSVLWQTNTFRNLKSLISTPDISTMRNLFKDIPIVLVSAGPSLDDAIPFLQEAATRAVIICVNTAYRKLIKNHIVPHITLAADPRYDTYRGYQDSPTDQTHIVCPFFVHPKVVEAFSGRAFTWAGNNALAETIRLRLHLPPSPRITEKGTISACIGDLASIWGSEKICLVGQDLAITESGLTHTKDSFYAESGNLYTKTEKCRKLPGNTKEFVYSDDKLVVYWKAFAEIVRTNPKLSFINTATLGARIDGVPYYSYDKALEWLGPKQNTPIREKIFHCHASNRLSQNPDEALNLSLAPTAQFSNKLLRLALDGAITLENIPEKFKNLNYKDHPLLKSTSHYGEQINQCLDQNPIDYKILFEGRTKKDLSAFQQEAHTFSTLPPHWANLCYNRAYFWALAEGCQFLSTAIHSFCPHIPTQTGTPG